MSGTADWNLLIVELDVLPNLEKLVEFVHVHLFSLRVRVLGQLNLLDLLTQVVSYFIRLIVVIEVRRLKLLFDQVFESSEIVSESFELVVKVFISFRLVEIKGCDQVPLADGVWVNVLVVLPCQSDEGQVISQSQLLLLLSLAFKGITHDSNQHIQEQDEQVLSGIDENDDQEDA